MYSVVKHLQEFPYGLGEMGARMGSVISNLW